jgi:hypothetical protein
MGQVLRGFSVGSRGYGYASVPDGEAKHDKKGRLRTDGFKLVIVPEEARIIQRIFREFIDGKAVTKIAKEMNAERIPTKARLKGGWNVSTISRILKDEKYIGRFVWNRTTTAKDPLTGKIEQVDRPKEEWVVQERPDIGSSRTRTGPRRSTVGRRSTASSRPSAARRASRASNAATSSHTRTICSRVASDAVPAAARSAS